MFSARSQNPLLKKRIFYFVHINFKLQANFQAFMTRKIAFMTFSGQTWQIEIIFTSQINQNSFK